MKLFAQRHPFASAILLEITFVLLTLLFWLSRGITGVTFGVFAALTVGLAFILKWWFIILVLRFLGTAQIRRPQRKREDCLEWMYCQGCERRLVYAKGIDTHSWCPTCGLRQTVPRTQDPDGVAA